MRRKFMPKARRISRSSSREGALRQDAQPCFYLYRQIMGQHSADRPRRRGELRGLSARHHQKTRTHAPGQGGRPRAAHRDAELADRPGVPDLSRRRRRWMNSSRRKSAENAGRGFHRARTACATRPGSISDADEIKFIEARVCRDSVSLHRGRPSSQRGGGAGFSNRARARATAAIFSP